MEKDPIKLAIDALEKANMQLTGLGANNTVYTREAIDHLRALQSQPAAAHGVEGPKSLSSFSERTMGNVFGPEIGAAIYVSDANGVFPPYDQPTCLMPVSKSPGIENWMNGHCGQKPLPADKQAALDAVNIMDEAVSMMRDMMNEPPQLIAMNVDAFKADMDGIIRDLRKHGATIRAALTAPQPVADLEGLKMELRGIAYPDGCSGISDKQYIRDFMMLDRIADHLASRGMIGGGKQPIEDNKCQYCKGTGSEADYVGDEMRCVEVDCSFCKGAGTKQPTEDAQRALDQMHLIVFDGCDDADKVMETIRAALTAPQPVADLEGLKTECHGAASAQCNHAQHPYKWVDASLDHLHATGRLTTSADIQDLKDAVRDLSNMLTLSLPLAKGYASKNRVGLNPEIIVACNSVLEKHAPTIAKVTGV